MQSSEHAPRRFESDTITVRGLIDGGTSISSPLKVVPVEAESFKVKLNTLKLPKIAPRQNFRGSPRKIRKKTGKHH